MKIEINNKNYRYISDNTNELDESTAFFCTKQNEIYLDIAKEKAAAIITPKVLETILDINDMIVVGITGTNGKTTTAAAIYSFLIDLNQSVALQGTRGFFIDDKMLKEKSLTTPPLLETMHNIWMAKQRGCRYFIMEVSSHAISQNRVENLKFALKVFTNISQDHLDYHKNFDEYKRVKSLFFKDDSKKLINKDAKSIDFNTKNSFTYALDAPATFNITAFSLNDGIAAIVRNFKDESNFHSPMQGLFNVYNLLAAIATVKLITEYSLDDICGVVSNFAGVSGRMEVVCYSPLIIVDFAHTPDGMQQVLDSLKDKKISLVFGAGGDRDRDKRAKMGRVANRFSKKIYLTSDNPRSEEAKDIIMDIYEGIIDKNKVKISIDRQEAIKMAIDELEDDEILMILGKGDEEYQEIDGKKIPFDDRKVVRKILQI